MSEKQFRKGDYTNCRCNICEIIDEDDEVVCNVATEDVEKVIGILEENEQLKHDATVLICSNQEYREENEKLKQFQERVAEVINGKMGDNVCNGYKMEILKEIWNELDLDEVWFE